MCQFCFTRINMYNKTKPIQYTHLLHTSPHETNKKHIWIFGYSTTIFVIICSKNFYKHRYDSVSFSSFVCMFVCLISIVLISCPHPEQKTNNTSVCVNIAAIGNRNGAFRDVFIALTTLVYLHKTYIYL